MSMNFPTMYFLRSFTVSRFTFQSLIYIELIFVCGLDKGLISFFTYGHLVFPKPFVKDSTFSPFCIHGTLVKH